MPGGAEFNRYKTTVSHRLLHALRIAPININSTLEGKASKKNLKIFKIFFER
jgi:hypothetical protein